MKSSVGKKRDPLSSPVPFSPSTPCVNRLVRRPRSPPPAHEVGGLVSIRLVLNIPQVPRIPPRLSVGGCPVGGGGYPPRIRQGRELGQGAGIFRPFSVRFGFILSVVIWGVYSQMGLFWLTRGQGGAFGAFSGDLSRAGVSGLTVQNTMSSGAKENPAQGRRGVLCSSFLIFRYDIPRKYKLRYCNRQRHPPRRGSGARFRLFLFLPFFLPR